jgi:hypothetical protein
MTFLPGLASTKNHRALALLASRSEDRPYELLSPEKGELRHPIRFAAYAADLCRSPARSSEKTASKRRVSS